MFSIKQKQKTFNDLFDVSAHESLFFDIKKIQNQIDIISDSPIVAITSLEDDLLSVLLGKAFSDVYSKNCYRTLLIDANVCKPQLRDFLISQGMLNNSFNTTLLEPFNAYNNLDIFFFNEEQYPSHFFKSNRIKQFLDSLQKKYDRVVLLIPNVLEHEETLFVSSLTRVLLIISIQDSTSKELVFRALSFCKENFFSQSKIILLKNK